MALYAIPKEKVRHFALVVSIILPLPGIAQERSAPQVVISHLAEPPDSGAIENQEERSGYREDSVAPYLWEDWVPSPDGTKLMAWTHDFPESGFRILNLIDLSQTVVRDGFDPIVHPVFNKESRAIRYTRRVPGMPNQGEVVTRQLSDGSTVVAQVIPLDQQQAENRQPFSPNGAVGVFMAGDGSSFMLDWRNGSACKKIELPDSPDIAHISDDGSLAILRPKYSERGNSSFFIISAVALNKGERTFPILELDVSHEPALSVAFPPSPNGKLFLAQRTSGPSLGLYSEGLFVWDREKGAPEPVDIDTEQILSIETIHTSEQERMVGIFATNGRVLTIDPGKLGVIHRYETKDVLKTIFASESRNRLRKTIFATKMPRAFIPVIGGGIRVLDLQSDGTAIPSIDIFSVPGSGWFAITANGACDFSPGAGEHVYIRKGEKLLPFSEAGEGMKAPEKVLKALAAFKGDQ